MEVVQQPSRPEASSKRRLGRTASHADRMFNDEPTIELHPILKPLGAHAEADPYAENKPLTHKKIEFAMRSKHFVKYDGELRELHIIYALCLCSPSNFTKW